MKMMGFVPRDFHDVPLKETKAGTIASIVLSLASMGALSVCLTRRVQNVRDWSRLPLVCWLVLIIYVDSICFVAGTAVLSNGFGVDSSHKICEQALLLCLSCYVTTKVLLYYFLVERAYIIRRSSKPRFKDKLYLFNSCGMLIPYCVVIALNFYFRFANYENGSCRIGMKRVAMIPLIAFDVLVNLSTPTRTIETLSRRTRMDMLDVLQHRHTVQRPRPSLDNLQRQRLHHLVPKRRANPLNSTHPIPKAPRSPAPSFRDRRLRARAARMAGGNRCHDRRVCERTRRRVGVGQNKYHSSECGHHRDGTY
ncbi:uncharacterized protein K444DRAFT_110101 [Hyaloscypha bicolor E]|uniref:Uncharacterized protein n=1 Tax=Hyaloscypha bicolor E TaxID=1095630 RepID=A0A2J6SV49_9HELO|nr:uncharacterized protein K444DRAFT_110101 [Hyaloscypha bicolor E]PMD54651.1 hypothetical protein K444DRAFT_110101 [Hyaloscypha bicolor E]